MTELRVVTYNGSNELRSDCVFIRGKYFHKERDCFFYQGRYYSPFSRFLVVDNETGNRVHRMAKELEYGIINFDGENYEFGYYSENFAKNGKLLIPRTIGKQKMEDIIAKVREAYSVSSDYTEDRPRSSRDEGRRVPHVIDILDSSSGKSAIVNCIDIRPLISGGMVQSKNSDCVCATKDMKIYNSCRGIPFSEISASQQYNFDLAYNSEVMMGKFSSYFEKNSFPTSRETRDLSAYIKDYTFGVEYESWDGRLPTNIAASNGLIPLRDGSLRHDGICGYEYATVVMSGEKGLSAIKSQCKALSEYATFNERCSMHIHVGNIPKTKENLINLYKGFYSIQKSIYSMFPSCLMNTQEYKQKAYCSPIPSMGVITEDKIVNWLSDGNETFRAFGRPHPRDPRSDRKWEIHSRYSIFNLNNYYYTDRGTVELRVSTPTFNHNKVSALLAIFCLIIDNAIKGEFFTDIEELVSKKTSGSIKTWLLGYIKYRKSVLSKWNQTDRGVIYFETPENDGETGCEFDLY